ncbi:YceI family protein [Flavihumibacter sp. CACIAM 22H1]|uniref:YceI family protein n=1 Tax=Flavihumibacter sp. CACIAM 22H1 TaxID=1812911 RepID=UPI000AEFDC3A|nr:YceI family protein [Flavihumibacter sp. CACIAM 22H1]
MNSIIAYISWMAVLVFPARIVYSQQYNCRTLLVQFVSVTPLETIKAENKNGVLLLDLQTGRVEAAVLIKGFLFRKALMQQHFNESYMESDKFPKAVFSGRFDPALVSSKQAGEQVIPISGTLTMHGVSKPHACDIILKFSDTDCQGFASFFIKPEDFSIQVPALVRDNINKQLKVELSTGWMKPNTR